MSSSGASDGPADQETPAGGVWCCSRGEGPDDHCASDASVFSVCVYLALCVS